MTHPFGDLAAPLDKATRDAIRDTVPIPHSMPSAPFSKVRAKWLCRVEGCGDWNAKESTECRTCHQTRTEL